MVIAGNDTKKEPQPMAARSWKSSVVIRECVAEFGEDINQWPEDDRKLVQFAMTKAAGPELEAAEKEGWQNVATMFEGMGK